ncbi:MAG: efflux RND transporter periplasmic adaptor subunit [Bacteroidia bacterium]|nr:efflux RND transporter periplasmic adaptor subunit [Bacteroidia bacterium]NND26262.1 efflux RND transporter periplasmic adaptor subunit [Flavobacteriaceae bacterium]NNK61212.1 efflux RND transporter periplasmic adaptor subunit [Flavobacteriaceae bacterium]RZW53931.1 MAG: efflux RND transporter periplasmic adaptor subunit [Flavobacteriaceae bacterium]
MKYIFTLILTSLLIVSCGGEKNTDSVESIIEEGDLVKMKMKRDEIIQSYDSISDVLGTLEKAISEKDTLKRLPLVTSFKIKDTLFNHFIDIQGSVDTNENLIIYPEYSGTLTTVYVKEGQYVSKGQLLARIDDGGLSSQLAQLQTQFQLAQTTFERQKRLWEQKIGSEIQYLQAKANMESLESSVKQMQAQLSKTTVRAPFSGTIDEIITDQGQVVSPGGTQLMRIVSLKNMFVKASIPENYLSTITKGTAVHVKFPSLGQNITGEVRQVGNFINPNNRTFEVEIGIPNKEQLIKPNLVANLLINDYSKENAIVIPDNVIQENARGDKFVYLINDLEDSEAKVIKTKIETGLSYNGYIEVLNGLESGQIIVKDGAITMRDGLDVKVQ